MNMADEPCVVVVHDKTQVVIGFGGKCLQRFTTTCLESSSLAAVVGVYYSLKKTSSMLFSADSNAPLFAVPIG